MVTAGLFTLITDTHGVESNKTALCVAFKCCHVKITNPRGLKGTVCVLFDVRLFE